MNPDKTKVMITKNNDGNRRLNLKTNDGKTVTDNKTMRILGFLKNSRDTYESHLGMVSSIIHKRLDELKPFLKHMNLKNCRETVYSKVASSLTYDLELYAGQNQWTTQRVTAILMRCNRSIYRKDYFLVSNNRICRDISVDPPALMCQKAAVKFIHRVIRNQAPKQIFEKLKFNKHHRNCSKINLKNGFRKEASKRTLIHTSIQLFNNLKPTLKFLPKNRYKSERKKKNP